MKTSIVIAAHNEEKNIGLLLKGLLKFKNVWDELIIVNDHSTDRTGEIAEKFSKVGNVMVIHRCKGNKGMGFALREGTIRATGDIIVWIMGDCSDDLNTVPRIVGKIKEGYDLVIGSRYMKGGSKGALSLRKAIMGMGYTVLCRLILGIKIHDVTNAFRGFRKEVFENVGLEAGDFAISPEFTIKAHLKRYKLGEVPTTYFGRRTGKTKFSTFRMGIRYLSMFKYRFFKFSPGS